MGTQYISPSSAVNVGEEVFSQGRMEASMLERRQVMPSSSPEGLRRDSVSRSLQFVKSYLPRQTNPLD